MANTNSHGYKMTAVRTLADIASSTTGSGKADPPHSADRLPLPRESQSRTRMLTLLRACATDETGSGAVEAQAQLCTAICTIVVGISWHPGGLPEWLWRFKRDVGIIGTEDFTATMGLLKL